MPKGKALLGLPVALSLICLAVGCSSEDSTDSELARPVKTMVVAAGDEPRVRVFPGRVEASKRVDLAFQVPGLLVKLPGKEGDAVHRGETIAQLRQDEFQARLKTAQGQLDQARATLNALLSGERSADAKLANARTESDRYARLVQSRAVSQSEYELTKTAHHIAQEEREAARQAVEAQEAVVRGLEGRAAEAKLQLRDSTLRAPYDGVIAQRLVDEGQNIVAGNPAVKFQDAGEIDIVVDVPEAFMASEIRSAASLDMVAEFSFAPGRQFPVTLKEATQAADPKTQTFQVRFAMEVPSGVTPLPGMTATVTVAYEKAGIPDHLLVPVSAVTRLETGQQVVWVIGPDQIVSHRPVKIGAATGGHIEIVKGLQPGDRIAVAGVTFLRQGMKVRDLGDALGDDQP